MKLKPAICPQCKATLSVESEKEKAICPYCNTEILTDNAIKSFKIAYNITDDDVSSSDIQYSSLNDFKIVAGVLKEYTGSCVHVKIPNTVKIIDYNAFNDCYGLESVEFPKCVREINGFENCKSLETISIPSTVEILGGFRFCTNLKKVYIAEGVKEIKSYAFANCDSLKEIVIPSSVETIRTSAFSSCKNLEIVTIKNINTCLERWSSDDGSDDDYPFQYCFNIKQLNAPLDWKKKYYNFFYITRDEYAPQKPQTKGCYIATSVYGSYDCPEVWVLRRYRDSVLSNTFYGRIFIRIYYTISPVLVNYFGNSELFSRFFKIILDKCINRLQNRGFSNAYYNDVIE